MAENPPGGCSLFSLLNLGGDHCLCASAWPVGELPNGSERKVRLITSGPSSEIQRRSPFISTAARTAPANPRRHRSKVEERATPRTRVHVHGQLGSCQSARVRACLWTEEKLGVGTPHEEELKLNLHATSLHRPREEIRTPISDKIWPASLQRHPAYYNFSQNICDIS